MIFFITRKYPPHIGGMERFCFKLNKNLKDIFKFPILAWRGRQWILPFFIPWAFLCACFYRLKGTMKCCYLADGLLAPLGILIKILLRVPVVVTIHGRDIAFSLKIYQWIIPKALSRFDRIICVSNYLRNECIKRGVPGGIIRVVCNGVDLEDFRPVDLDNYRSRFEKMADASFAERKLMLTVARLMPKKGIDSFLQNILPAIVKENDHVLYLIVGEGPMKEDLENLIDELKLHDHAKLLGHLAMKSGDLPAIYNICDVFVMPNLPVPGDVEGFGIVALEAGAAGLPVVASKVDGIKDAIVDGKNGFLVNHDDYAGYAKVILDLLEDDGKRIAFADAAKSYLRENYSWEKIALQYTEVFKEIAGNCI